MLNNLLFLNPKNIGDATVGRQAGLMSQAMRKLSGKCFKTETTLIFINQIRHKIGVMFGSPETTSGGNALKFYASQRVDVRRTGGIKDGVELVANSTKAKIIKNKIASPFKIAEFDIIYGKGIDIVGNVLQLAVDKDFVEKAGAWYSYKGEQLGQGKINTIKALKNNPKLYEEILTAVREIYQI
jgi:recombination protein RecA